jgi:hypothetical protein
MIDFLHLITVIDFPDLLIVMDCPDLIIGRRLAGEPSHRNGHMIQMAVG